MNDFSNSFDDKLTATIVDGSGENSWPISGYTYMILHTTMKDCAKEQKLVAFLKWALTDASAAKTASDLGYSVLPSAVRDQVLTRLAQVSCQ
jgi:phosphate transport system substrate-binding protein